MSDADEPRVGFGSAAFVAAAGDYVAELLNLVAEVALSSDSSIEQAVKARRLLDRIEITAVRLLELQAEEHGPHAGDEHRPEKP